MLSDSAWLSKTGKGKYGWEELPYWLRGYLELAWILDDAKMKTEAQFWIEGVLASQRPDGDFGPDQRFEDGSRDFWANMIMLYCLQTYHEHTGEPRVLDLMTKYFKYQLSVPDNQMLTQVVAFGYAQGARVGHVLESMRRTGRQHALVVDYDELPPPNPLAAAAKRAMVRGIFSTSQIAYQLGVAPPPGGEIANTFSEIEAALGR